MQLRNHPTTQLRSGYGCHSLDPNYHNLQIVSGDDFLPRKMCKCLAGWSGAGTACRMCDNSSYNGEVGATYCTPCPDQGNTGRLGALSVSECKCPKGRQRVGKVCGCAELQAKGDSEVCIFCGERNLNCSEQGMVARDAPALDGYARLDPGLE